MNPPLHRPQPFTGPRAKPVKQTAQPEDAAKRLREGEYLRVTDHYDTGVQILHALQRQMPAPPQNASYARRQSHRRRLRAATLRLLAPIQAHRLALSGSEEIGFLHELYPDQLRFMLPFAQVQELYGAWQRYQEGIHLAVLGHRLHPFYGTYVPTRMSHLELFGTWLSQYQGPRESAIDVGTGCGVLALMLCRAGLSQVLATDISPNAIESVSRDLARLPKRPPVTLSCTDLLGEDPTPRDLVVFNPPWMRGEQDGLLDQALYYPDGLFERFFDQAHRRLTADGRIVLIFSSVLRLVQPDAPHPIEAELDRGRLRLVQKMHRKVKPKPGPDGQRRRTQEKVEIWELAQIKA